MARTPEEVELWIVQHDAKIAPLWVDQKDRNALVAKDLSDIKDKLGRPHGRDHDAIKSVASDVKTLVTAFSEADKRMAVHSATVTQSIRTLSESTDGLHGRMTPLEASLEQRRQSPGREEFHMSKARFYTAAAAALTAIVALAGAWVTALGGRGQVAPYAPPAVVYREPGEVALDPPEGKPIPTYPEENCVGTVVNGVCRGGVIVTEPPKHCYGEWIDGECTGPHY